MIQQDIVVDQTASPFKFIDLFAGIGGLRWGFDAIGGECVFTCEMNKFSQETYRANFGEEYEIAGDITLVDAADIPSHDLLLAGFPCQPFSLAGVSKKNSLGRAHGFADETQGTLFFDVVRILRHHQPRAFLLENVKNLLSHDKGNTMRVILHALDELGYEVNFRVIDAKSWVPQHRERIFIAGFRRDHKTTFSFNDVHIPEGPNPTLTSILHPEDGSEMADERYTVGKKGKVHDRYTLTDGLWSYLQGYAAKHKAAGNGFGFGLVTPDKVARTLSARYHKDGSEILVSQGKRKRPLRLTPRKCARLMGFPDCFIIPVSDTQAYRLFGDSVIVPLIKEIAGKMITHLVEQQGQDVKRVAHG